MRCSRAEETCLSIPEVVCPMEELQLMWILQENSNKRSANALPKHNNQHALAEIEATSKCPIVLHCAL